MKTAADPDLDRQFSIPAPDSWLKPGEEPSQIMIDCFGGHEFFLEVRGKLVRFEWSNQFGPLPINKDGSEARSIGPKHGFWRAASLWNLQGRRLDGDRAIWHEPRKPAAQLRSERGWSSQCEAPQREVFIAAIEAAVARERARCAAVVGRHLSPRNGIFLAKHPGEALRAAIEAIERGDEP